LALFISCIALEPGVGRLKNRRIAARRFHAVYLTTHANSAFRAALSWPRTPRCICALIFFHGLFLLDRIESTKGDFQIPPIIISMLKIAVKTTSQSLHIASPHFARNKSKSRKLTLQGHRYIVKHE